MPHKNGKKKSYKIAGIILIILILTAGWLGYKTFVNNVNTKEEARYLYIKAGTTYDDLIHQLDSMHILKDMTSFRILATQMGLEQKIKSGKYKVEKGESNFTLVKKLRNGQQEPVKLVINKFRTKDDFIKFISQKLDTDTSKLTMLLNNETFLDTLGLTPSTAMCMVVPDTYEFWWNTSAENLLKKLHKYYQKFWTAERKEKAQQQGLTPTEVITIASIIEEETNKNDEKPTIASVYLNRLRKGMNLGADPTVKFALNDFAIKRILNQHTMVVSPYNTYRVTGLPPGPICTPSKKSIDAVLTPQQTDYLYFCAKEDFSGYHSFASTYSQHQANAKRYHKALNERNIK